MSQEQLKSFTTLLLYGLVFLLLWEWLRPLKDVTDTERITVFVVFIAVGLLLSFLQIRLWLTVLIKSTIILFSINILYFQLPFFKKEWWGLFFEELQINVAYLFSQNWLSFTPSFRSLLFFILLWLLTYLMHYWVMIQKRILFFYIMTVIYITVLDTFTPYSATTSIIRVVMVGFLLLGLLHFERTKQVEFPRLSFEKNMTWILSLAVLVAMSATLGFYSPKLKPQWPDPVPYLKLFGQSDTGVMGQLVQKVGYGVNDSRLGGPFIEDSTVVFSAKVEQSHYWRVESKDVYTGKGWETSEDDGVRFVQQPNQAFTAFEKWSNKVKVTDKQATVTMNIVYPHITYPVQLTQVISDEPVELIVNPVTERVVTSPGSLQSYQVEYQLPSFIIDDLQAIQDPVMELEAYERYTQLPNSVPERVRNLAFEITSNKPNLYDKVKAVEGYFVANDFKYETKEVAVPTGRQDYVDQFLFETKQGYCDNFSTAMIVLLRSAGIPSRWVKGYTEGEFIERYDDATSTYDITNNNAHSWVEVYFEGIGWVPFEPTRGFSNPFDFSYDLNNIDIEASAPMIPGMNTERDPMQEFMEGDIGGGSDNSGESNWFTSIVDKLSWEGFFLIAGSLALMSLILFRTRRRWIFIVWLLMYKYSKKETSFFNAYNILLNQLKLYGLSKREGQTLREYAIFVDQSLGTTKMSELTSNYERALYRNDQSVPLWKQSVNAWQYILRKTAS
ncbi:transglutaminase family protein [Bacillus sp. HMF5848]|uniref:transglutaminase-like domain-containing protein n=1 Tax=Bacillus sp. HMF5848 TaxID=2495421 RepID=UPI000F76BC9C|nr:transglutaminase family protein [Bacillus sp. HMF5848]RSK25741.1 transglutaminase family protein [Bacillus sp. HMF5848]